MQQTENILHSSFSRVIPPNTHLKITAKFARNIIHNLSYKDRFNTFSFIYWLQGSVRWVVAQGATMKGRQTRWLIQQKKRNSPVN